MKSYLVRTWVDPFNERGQYAQSERVVVGLRRAVEVCENSERGVVLSDETVRPDSMARKVLFKSGD
jgi:hypothetical protein